MLFTKKDKRTKIEQAMDVCLEKMDTFDPSTKDYKDTIDSLSLLIEAKNAKAKGEISKDTLVVVAGNLAGILLILNFERLGIITSKSLGFVIKGRV